MKDKTPFEAAGYTKDDTFVVFQKETDDYIFSVGSIVKLKYDDESICPKFELVQGMCTNSDGLGYKYIRNLVKIAKNQTPFEAAGYTKDDLFIIPELDGNFKGVVFKLHRDDGLTFPYLKSVTPGVTLLICPSIDKLLKLRM